MVVTRKELVLVVAVVVVERSAATENQIGETEREREVKRAGGEREGARTLAAMMMTVTLGSAMMLGEHSDRQHDFDVMMVADDYRYS